MTAMPARVTITGKDGRATTIDALTAGISGELDAMIVKNLCYVGETCVKFAREPHHLNWGDRTGNLRSSIGYVVLRDGRPLANGMPRTFSGPDGDGSQGPEAAQRLLAKIQAEQPDGYVLAVCAGMEYASFVESVHHRDVLTGAQLRGEELAERLLTALFKKLDGKD